MHTTVQIRSITCSYVDMDTTCRHFGVAILAQGSGCGRLQAGGGWVSPLSRLSIDEPRALRVARTSCGCSGARRCTHLFRVAPAEATPGRPSRAEHVIASAASPGAIARPHPGGLPPHQQCLAACPAGPAGVLRDGGKQWFQCRGRSWRLFGWAGTH